MAVKLGKHLKDGKGLDSSGLPVPPSIAIDLSACQVHSKQGGFGVSLFFFFITSQCVQFLCILSRHRKGHEIEYLQK